MRNDARLFIVTSFVLELDRLAREIGHDDVTGDVMSAAASKWAAAQS